MDGSPSRIHPGDHVFLEGGSEEVGAVREVSPGGRPELVVYVENAGDFVVALGAVRDAYEEKVVLDPRRLPELLVAAIARAHAAEQPGL